MYEEKMPLIMIPALLANKKMYQHQIDTLNDIADVSVPEIHKHNNITDMAADIIAKAPAQFALAGVSMGGYVALEVMRQAPDRVTRLALINTKATKDSDEVVAKRQEAIDNMREETFIENVKEMAKKFYLPENDKDGCLSNLMAEMAKEVGMQGFINEMVAIINRIDSTPFLKDIKTKTAVICGRNDLIIDDMKVMATQIPLAKFVVVEACAHLSPIEQPIAISALIRYWLR